MERRKGYGFSNEDKADVRDRADGSCDFGDNSCERPNNNIVHHLTGCFEGRLKQAPKEWVSNAEENALMLCDLHTEMHDVEERAIVHTLYDANNQLHFEKRGRKNARHHRRRRRHR